MLPPSPMLTIKNQGGSDLAGGREKRALISTNVCKLALLLALLAGCTPPGPRALLEGKRLIDEGKYPQAIEAYRQALALARQIDDKERIDNLLFDLADVLIETGKFDEAASTLDQAAAAPNRDQAFQKLALVLLRANLAAGYHQDAQAEKLFRRILADSDDSTANSTAIKSRAGNGLALIFGLVVLEGVFKFFHPLGVGRVDMPLRGLPLRVELEELVGHVFHGLAYASFGFVPCGRAQVIELGLDAIRRAIFLD